MDPREEPGGAQWGEWRHAAPGAVVLAVDDDEHCSK